MEESFDPIVKLPLRQGNPHHSRIVDADDIIIAEGLTSRSFYDDAQERARLLVHCANQHKPLRDALNAVLVVLLSDAEAPVTVGDDRVYRLDGQKMYVAINTVRKALLDSAFQQKPTEKESK